MRRNIFAATAAAGAVLVLLAGCGGVPVEGTDAAVDATAAGVASADVVTTGATTPTADASAPTSSARVTGPVGAGGPTGPLANRAAQRTTKAAPDVGAGAGKVGASGLGTAAVSAVERVASTAPLFGGNAPCKAATLSEVPIGNVSTLSGVLGELFAPVRPALETFVTAQNACGGLNGHRIRLYFEDDQGDPSTASSKVQDLVQAKKVLAFVGNIQVLTVDAIVPVIKRFGIPVIGGDIASNTWFQNPLMFPQGPPPAAVAYGYLVGASQYFHKTKMADIYCIEVPRGCEQNHRALTELAPQFGITMTRSVQASITAPSYVQQCLDFQRSGAEMVALLWDAASMNRMARSCQQVGFAPKVLPTSLGVGNEKQFLTGNKWLGDAYVGLQFFPWFASDTPAERYWQAAVHKYNPGFDMGVAASAGWTAGALLAAAGAALSPTNPTTADLLQGLYQFHGQKWTGLGGLSGPRTFAEGKTPRIPYCIFHAISNADNTGWASSSSIPQCTDKLAPSDPQVVG